MFASFVLLFTIKRYIKNDKIFMHTMIALVILSYTLNYTVCVDWGIFRGIGGMALGILLSYVKPKTFKYKNLNLNFILSILAVIATILLAYTPKQGIFVDLIMIFIAFPALIYFTNTIKFENSFLNYLGSLSFGVYAYQCIVRIIDFYVPLDIVYKFLILLLIVLTMHYVTYLYNYITSKKKVLVYSANVNINEQK